MSPEILVKCKKQRETSRYLSYERKQVCNLSRALPCLDEKKQALYMSNISRSLSLDETKNAQKCVF